MTSPTAALSPLRQSRRGAPRPIIFNLLFWTPFWLVPVLALGVEQWPAVSAQDCLNWMRQGLVFTTAMAALAELCGRWRRYCYLVAGLLWWVGASLSIVFVATTGIRVNVFTALTGIVYAAPDLEGLRFLTLSSGHLLGILGAALPLPLLVRRWRHLAWGSSRSRAAVAVSLCLAMISARVAWHDYGRGRLDGAANLDTLGSIVDPGVPISTYVTLARALPLARELVLLPGRPAPRVLAPTRMRPLTIMVVVGESTTRNHMGLYGYCRDTTPLLSERAASLFVFRDTISEVPLTVFALSKGLRVALESRDGRQNQSIFDVFNAAAFHSYWLSNQYGAPGDPVGSVTRPAQHHLTTYHDNIDQGGGRSTLDEALLAPLGRILGSDPTSKIIFLHTIGSHSYYEDRVPPGFLSDGFREPISHRDARSAAVIDAYDKAVRYADVIVSETIGRAAQHGGDMAVVYVSDHGDEVFDQIAFVGHRYPRATRSMVEIPLVVWLSPQLRAGQPMLVDALAAARSKKIDIGDVTPLLLDIAGIEVDGLADRRRPLSSQFVPQQRLVGRVDYDADPTLGIRPSLLMACQ